MSVAVEGEIECGDTLRPFDDPALSMQNFHRALSGTRGAAAASRVVMHSDGLSARWSQSAYPGLHLRNSAVIAAILCRDFVRRRDDATVVVACLRP